MASMGCFIVVEGGERINWGVGMSLSMIASEKTGFANSYGLGQAATVVAAVWGVFVWGNSTKHPREPTLW